MVQTSFGIRLCTPLCAKFEAIWTMLGELMVHKSTQLWGWGRHDHSITSYLHYDSGLVEKDCLFTFIIFHGHHYMTHICAISEGFKRFWAVLNYISYKFWKVWSNYDWTDICVISEGFKRFWAVLNYLWILQGLVKLRLTYDWPEYVNSMYGTFRLIQMVFSCHNVMQHYHTIMCFAWC